MAFPLAKLMAVRLGTMLAFRLLRSNILLRLVFPRGLVVSGAPTGAVDFALWGGREAGGLLRTLQLWTSPPSYSILMVEFIKHERVHIGNVGDNAKGVVHAL